MKKIKIFADGADQKQILNYNKLSICAGFTTNPTLMKKDGVKDYEKFSKQIIKKISIKPISLECFADDFPNIERQALKIQSWGENVYVKIPVSNTKGESSYKTIQNLAKKNINLNITAVFTIQQVREIIKSIKKSNTNCNAIISVFAGRIADTGIDPIPLMKKILKIIQESKLKNVQLLWASPREILNIYQADKIGVHIITIPYSFFAKLKLKNKNLNNYSIETVKMFYEDAKKSKFKL
jgi:transaldolase